MLALRRPDLEQHVGIRRCDAVEVVELGHRVTERLRAHHDVERARRPVVVDEAQPRARAAAGESRASTRASLSACVSVARSLLNRDRGRLERARAAPGPSRGARRASRGRGRRRATSRPAARRRPRGLLPWTGRFRRPALRQQAAASRQKQAAAARTSPHLPFTGQSKGGTVPQSATDFLMNRPDNSRFRQFRDGCRLPVSEQIANVRACVTLPAPPGAPVLDRSRHRRGEDWRHTCCSRSLRASSRPPRRRRSRPRRSPPSRPRRSRCSPQVNQLNASLDRSDELVNLANLKLAQVKRDIAMNRRELVIARHNLAVSQRTVAKRLVNLYTTGSTSTLEVILGAQSLDEIIQRIDTANRVSTVDTQVANQVAQFKTSVLTAPLAALDRAGPGAAARRAARAQQRRRSRCGSASAARCSPR